MHRLIKGLGLFVVVGAVALWAGNRWSAGAESYSSLKKEFEQTQEKMVEAQKAAEEAFKQAKTDEQKQQAAKKLQELEKNDPLQKFGPRFFAFAEKNPQAPESFDALFLALRLSGGPYAKDDLWTRVLKQLEKDHLKSAKVEPLVRLLAGVPDESSAGFLRSLAENSPDRALQAKAWKALAANRQALAGMVQQIKDDKDLREQVQKQQGKELLDKLLAHDPTRLNKEAEKASAVLKEKYADLFPDVSVGKQVPEVVSQNLKGDKVKLSDLKGKVLVLDFWATWCGPCRALIPHQRELVKKMKDRPFELVSISADDEKSTVVDFTKDTAMPWTHWWAGASPKLLEAWGIEAFPTILVVDAKGTIREKFVGMGPGDKEKLDTLVEKLVREAEKPK